MKNRLKGHLSLSEARRARAYCSKNRVMGLAMCPGTSPPKGPCRCLSGLAGGGESFAWTAGKRQRRSLAFSLGGSMILDAPWKDSASFSPEDTKPPAEAPTMVRSQCKLPLSGICTHLMIRQLCSLLKFEQIFVPILPQRMKLKCSEQHNSSYSSWKLFKGLKLLPTQVWKRYLQIF